MNHQQFLTQMIGYPLVFLLLVACGTTAEPTPTPTVTPVPEPTATPTSVSTEAPAGWLYLALGISEAVCFGLRSYPQYYAEFIEQDLNIKGQLRNLGSLMIGTWRKHSFWILISFVRDSAMSRYLCRLCPDLLGAFALPHALWGSLASGGGLPTPLGRR